MTDGRSKNDFLKFLNFLSEKGLLAKATAQSRKASANKVFSILSDTEAADVTKIDLDDVMYRFSNLEGQKYTPQSLTTYKSRIRSALDDFVSYRENPLGFKPAIQQRSRSSKRRDAGPSGSPTPSAVQSTAANNAEEHDLPVAQGPTQILPIALRNNLTVQIAGLPFDLTYAEAKKIANIVLAHALSDQ